jgi:hypothetical protein
MTLAQIGLRNFAIVADRVVNAQFFTRSTIYVFEDGSTLTLNMYGTSYAAPAHA